MGSVRSTSLILTLMIASSVSTGRFLIVLVRATTIMGSSLVFLGSTRLSLSGWRSTTNPVRTVALVVPTSFVVMFGGSILMLVVTVEAVEINCNAMANTKYMNDKNVNSNNVCVLYHL